MTTQVRRPRRRGEGSLGALVAAGVVLRKAVARLVFGNATCHRSPCGALSSGAPRPDN